MKWNKLATNIPARVKIGRNKEYEVVTIKDFKGEPKYGLTDFTKKILYLKEDLGHKNKVVTYFHEVLHALSEEHQLNLTEGQILNFEAALPYLLKIMKGL